MSGVIIKYMLQVSQSVTEQRRSVNQLKLYISQQWQYFFLLFINTFVVHFQVDRFLFEVCFI